MIFSGVGILAGTLARQVDNEDEEGSYPLDKPRNPPAVFFLAEKVDLWQGGRKKNNHMNAIYLAGALVENPKHSTGKKAAFTKFVVAHKGSTEKRDASVEFIAFGEVAEFIAQLRQGQGVVVQGRFQTGTFQRKDGGAFTSTSVIADSVTTQ